MPNLRDIKNRIKSVQSTGKITQAMKMVASSKVKKAESAAKESRPFSKFLVKVFAELANSGADFQSEETKFECALENYPALLKKREIKNVGLFVVTSDKGLAGSYNANVIKEAMSTINEYKNQGIGVKIFIVGLKGITALKKVLEDGKVENIKNYAKKNDVAFGPRSAEELDTEVLNFDRPVAEIDDKIIVAMK